jgi:hypothetical protein
VYFFVSRKVHPELPLYPRTRYLYIYESMCVGDLGGNADCAGAKAGGSEVHVNKSSEEMSNVNNVSGAQCFDASKLLPFTSSFSLETS